MRNKLILRIVLDIILFGSALIGAWWLIFPIGVVSVWYYKKFFEFPLAALAFDAIYAAPRDKFFSFEYIYTLVALALFVIVVVLKSQIRRNLWRRDF